MLRGCGLPPAWAAQAQWRILDTGPGSTQRFADAWRAWKADPQRPRILHFVSIGSGAPELGALPQELARECYGLLPGVHRIGFERGQVLLTLCIGEPEKLLRELDFHADSVFITGAGPNLKALARRCRRGTRLLALDADAGLAGALARHGFRVDPQAEPGLLQAQFAPAWEPRGQPPTHTLAGDCIVIGAGLAGAAVAASLARRGWQVRVLDAAPTSAGGASGLPAGLLAPHSSPDDNLLSRLSRDGVRATLQQAQALLEPGRDWEPSGVLEHHVDGRPFEPAPATEHAAVWSRPADAQHKRLAGLDAGVAADWHEKAAWIRPGELVRAWLAQPGVLLQGEARVARLLRAGGRWQALDADGHVIAQAALVIVAAAYASRDLLPTLSLQAVRGQVSWALHEGPLELPPFPVNGDGSFIPSVPTAQGQAWLCGASFERSDTGIEARAADQHANLARLRRLLPGTARALEPVFAGDALRAWTGIRCASTDRRPLVGPVNGSGSDGLWVSTAMGSRGLSFAALCGELIAARLHGEPLPLARNLARALAPDRQKPLLEREKALYPAPNGAGQLHFL